MRLRAAERPDFPSANQNAEAAHAVLDELCDEQLSFSMSLACLEEAVAHGPRDPSALAALRTVAARIADLGALRDALGSLHQRSIDPRVAALFVPDGPLADYTRGLYAWAHAVVRALEHLVDSLRKLAPDWAVVRWRIEEAQNFHFDELFVEIRAEVASLAAIPHADELDYAVEHLFTTATALGEHLDERFG